MKRLILLSMLLGGWLTIFAAGNTRLLQGEVKDEAGEELTGVTVKVDATTIATATDIDGKFSLNVPADRHIKLIVSYVGYATQNLDVSPDQNNINITMQVNASDMNEVVVIGYGTAKKSSLTSSVEVIKASDLQKIPSMNIDQSLAGQVSGMGVTMTSADPSSAKESRISVRGNDGNPLLVIDGVPRLGTNTGEGEMRLSDLNPDDIESISILKDAAAAAVYGVRAANGVILVQTKRGQSSGRARVNYRGQFNFEQATNLPKFLNARDFATLYNRAAAEDDTHTAIDLDLLGSDPNIYADENLMDHLSKWGHTQRHSVSISGGGANVRYFLSGAYSESKGLYSNIGRSRYNYSGKIDADLFPGLTASVDFTGSVSDYKNTSYATLDEAYTYSPLQVLRFTNGQLASIEGANPLVAMEGLGGYTKEGSDFHTVSAVLRYDIPLLKGLQVYLRGTMDFNHINTTIYNKPVDLYTYDALTGTFAVDPSTVYPEAKITMSERFQRVKNKLIEAGITYNNTFDEKHDVSATIVANYQEYNNKSLRGLNNNKPGALPEVIGSASTEVSIFGNEYFTQRASLVGRATYGFSNRYFAEFSFRVDGSTRFAPGKRWGFFPTVSASWVISNEDFFKNVSPSAISQAKIRASAGILGDDGESSDFSYYQSYNTTNSEGYNFGGVWIPTLIPSISSFPNPDLTWGRSKDYNLGVDLGFWNNRVTASVELYQRTRTHVVTDARDQLFPPSVGTGGVKALVNSGKVRYRGVDFTIRHMNQIGDLHYNLSFNIGTSDNIVLDWDDESTLPENQRRKGKTFSIWNLYEAAGLFQSEEEIRNWPDQDGFGNSTLRPGDIKYVDQDNDGKITITDKVFVKNASLPDVSYGFGFGAEWKGLYFNAQFAGMGGYSQKVNELYTLESGSLQRFQNYHLTDTWTPENPDASYPRIKFASSSDNNRFDSTFWLKSCSFLRLKAVTIGYRVPSHLLRRSHISTIDIALQGSNLHTWSSLDDGMDPEVLRGYPITRGYGVSLTFGF